MFFLCSETGLFRYATLSPQAAAGTLLKEKFSFVLVQAQTHCNFSLRRDGDYSATLHYPHKLPLAPCSKKNFRLSLCKHKLTTIFLCGETGIRTPETLLRFTRFPGVPLQPLEHLSIEQIAPS